MVRICMRAGQPDAARTPRTFARLLERIAREPRVPLALHRECVCLEVDSGDRSADSAVCHLCAWCSHCVSTVANCGTRVFLASDSIHFLIFARPLPHDTAIGRCVRRRSAPDARSHCALWRQCVCGRPRQWRHTAAHWCGTLGLILRTSRLSCRVHCLCNYANYLASDLLCAILISFQRHYIRVNSVQCSRLSRRPGHA